ncbi:MAG TPA: molecular chaperone HtpG [Lentisphaeria bacterium]|nr:MAG: molecular chaperone HtpG [Lentisphaerae bacterium GWF2_38_69]HBM15745.1 molecular chaperone HtpG [Lentisphaeria bacterium]
MTKETRKFEAQTQKVLDLMIHSLYSNKDIFLRELIANSADAIDKARFLSLSHKEVAQEWSIRVDSDKKAKKLTISDNGIGMTRDEIIKNIGTIAHSGTKSFLEEMTKSDTMNAPELIGQFGVGFYSAFMIADCIEIETKKAGSSEPSVKWISTGNGEYAIEESSRIEQGTTIVLELKKDEEKYLDAWKVREIVKKYSDFIEYPVRMKDTVKEAKPKKNPDDNDEKTEYIDIEKDEILNSQKAIWLRNPKEITEDEYKQFFDHLSHSSDDPLKTIHFSAEGTSEFKALLYIPGKNPFNFFAPDMRKKSLHLYIRRIFITDECQGLLPEYLRFVNGVVDSSDLPLNVSREMLQDNPAIDKISKNLVKKIITTLTQIKDNEQEKYVSFFKEFGKFIKEGVHVDYANKDKLQDLLLFETMKSEPGKLVSLKDYVSMMPSSQKDIYYIAGESRALLENSPHLEVFKSKGYDVIFMTEPIDEFVAMSLYEYDKKSLKAIGKGELDIDTEEEKKARKDKEEAAKKEYSSLLEFIQKKLDENIKEVRFSHRLTDSACCLVGGAYDQSPYMEKIMKAMNQNAPKTKRILEINPNHPLISSLKNLFEKNNSSPKLGDYAQLLYDQALLAEGSPIANPLQFAKRVSELMVIGLEKESIN